MMITRWTRRWHRKIKKNKIISISTRTSFLYGFHFMTQQIPIKYILILSIVILFSISSGCIGGKTVDNETKISQGLSSEKNRIATIVTEKGTIKFELYEKE